jgi:hypothetical protein
MSLYLMRPSLASSFWVVISEWGNSCGFSSHPVDPLAPNHVTFHFFFNSRRPGLTNHPYMVILTRDTPLVFFLCCEAQKRE